MGLDLLCTEGLQEGGTLVGPQCHSLPLGLGFTVRAIPRAGLGHAPSIWLHQLLQAGVHVLWVHAIHHVRRHATLHWYKSASQSMQGGVNHVLKASM